MLRPICTPLLLATVLVSTACASDETARTQTKPHQDQQAAPPPTGLIGATKHFVFYSRPDFNLHDRLVQWSARAAGQGGHLDDDDHGHACLAAQPPDVQAGWRDAVDAYAALYEGKPREDGSLNGGFLGLVLRFELLEPGFKVRGEHGAPTWFRPALAKARAAYEACWWPADDQQNRALIEAALPMIREVEGALAQKIAKAHAVEWPSGRHPVDVVPVVNFGGANTVHGPNHTLFGSTMPGNDGFGTIEILFHEVSHTFCSPRGGGTTDALLTAAKEQGVELPRDLWHAVLFFVAGRSAEGVINKRWDAGYRQYAYTQKVFERAWPELIGPIEETLSPYLAGRSSLPEASSALVRVVGRPVEVETPVDAEFTAAQASLLARSKESTRGRSESLRRRSASR